MLFFLSPAKTLDFETASPTEEASEPQYLTEASELIALLKEMTPNDISSLMGLSDQLAQLNAARYDSWKKSRTANLKRGTKACMFAFKGDVYTGLQAETFSKMQVKYAQKHLRILSGLYGILKPLDVIHPYRLEMGTKLANNKGKDLYHFWGDKLALEVNKQLKALKSDTIINLASNEYFKSIKRKSLQADIVTPVFKDEKRGQYKVISFFAKKARGMMAAYAIKHGIKEPEQLKAFSEAGYWYNEEASSDREWVFYREAQ